jgi:hypothetical protein
MIKGSMIKGSMIKGSSSSRHELTEAQFDMQIRDY